jgi:hypothetical protein
MSEEIDWEEHVGVGEPQEPQERLTIIGELTEELVKQFDEIEKIEEQLRQKREQYRMLSEVTLPEQLLALGLTELKHESGVKLVLETFYQAKIPDSKEQEAYDYLERTGNDSIIKTDVTAKFGKGEKEEAMKMVNILREQGVVPQVKTGIHHSTLRAFVKEQLESGAPGFPQEAFGVYVGNRIKIK